MTELLHVTTEGSLSVREDAEGDGRTIEGIAVPYGKPTRSGATREYGNRREAFRQGAFASVMARRGDRPFPAIDVHDGTVIAGVRLSDTPEGLRYSGRILNTQAARDWAEAAREGLIAPSIEFAPGKYAERGDVVEHTDVAAFGGIAFTYKPAYDGTTVAIREAVVPENETGATPDPLAGRSVEDVVRAGGGVKLDMTPAQIHALVTEAADEAYRRNMEGTPLLAARETTIYDEYATFGELFHAAAQEGASRELRSYAARALATRALDDIVMTAGANAGAVTANTFGTVRRLVQRTRRTIEAFGGPAPLFGTGTTFGYPYFDGTLTDLVGAQSEEKAEITSAVVDIKRATATIATYAGGADISLQLIRRSEPGYLEMWGQIMLAAWALVTNAAFVTALEAGSVTGDFTEALATVDATELKNRCVAAAGAGARATGQPAEFVLAGTNAFKAAAKLMTPTPVVNAAGSANARTLEVNVGGLPVIHEPSLTTAKFLVSNSFAAKWHEEGPFQAASDDVAKLGRDVAYWSMGAPAIYVPAAVIEVYDVTP
jgi:phage head maturation protease